MALLETKELTKRFGGLTAIDRLDFHVEEGEIVAVIGPNGAGKTTLFNLISGMFRPDDGQIWFGGHNIVGLHPDEITKLGLARTFQNVRLFRNMTVLQNAMVAQHCRTKSGIVSTILHLPSFRREEQQIRVKAREALSFFGTRLAGFRHEQPAIHLSYANRRRLEIARAMATEPKLILLDEPTAGMNPSETQELTDQVGRMRDEKGLTICFIEHDMRVVRGVADRVVVLDYGRKIAEGNYGEVAESPQVVEAYLGRGAAAQAG